MHLREEPRYRTWEEFWDSAHTSPYFKAEYDDTSEKTDWSLSERQLFTQSNGRTLLGQDTMGRMHFLCTPHNRIYAVPSGGEDLGGQFKGHIGQYYQNDTALFLGKMRFELEMENGLFLAAANRSSVTEYLDYFLPVTATEYPELTAKVFSFAPVLEQEALAESLIHPLPGPACALFCMEIQNTAGCTLKGKLRLSFDQKFVNQFEHYGKRFEDYTQNPYRAEWDQKLLILWHPEACAAIQLLDSVCEGNAENPRIYVPFELKEKERRVFTAVVTLAPEREEIYENLGVVYQHTPLEWLNVTGKFWRDRLGEITAGIRENEAFGVKYSDMHIRFILDNFNCLSFNSRGELLTNWQGAPSHSLSRLWGIDIEPNVVSVMYAIPEVGLRAIEYLAKRNRPRFSLYSDHSMFFYIAPLVIAGKYLELTGDSEYFRKRLDIMAFFHEVYSGMLAHKHKEKTLFSSHYASDLIVFKKYDYGANVQCYYALKTYCVLCKITGTVNEEAEGLLAHMPEDMAESMETEGVFGRQITGGSNLGENTDRFYISDEMFYYGGEDTATVLAPLYGLYEFNYEPYVNLHRFARSMYITNYDPEFQTLRELHFGMNPSATGCTLRLGGSYTRREMESTLKLLYERLDETGSLFWWPRAYNKKRCLTRCSQGQGAWVQQSVEQWFGLRMDGMNKTLTIKPQGLLSSYYLRKICLGRFRFTIRYQEQEGVTEFYIENLNHEAIQIKLYVRPFGAAAEGELTEDHLVLPAGEITKKRYLTKPFVSEEVHIVQMECRAFSGSGRIFSPYGIVMPKLSGGSSGIFLLRFVASHMEEQEWGDAQVEIIVPKGWKVTEKKYYYWDYQPVFKTANRAVTRVSAQQLDTHGVAGFYVSLPDNLVGDERSVMLSEHPFSQTATENVKPVKLLVEGPKTEEGGIVKAILRINGQVCEEYFLPVQILSKEEYRSVFDKMYHGE